MQLQKAYVQKNTSHSSWLPVSARPKDIFKSIVCVSNFSTRCGNFVVVPLGYFEKPQTEHSSLPRRRLEPQLLAVELSIISYDELYAGEGVVRQ